MKTFFLKAIILALFFAAYSMAGTFYFLPPNDPEWIKKTPHLICTGNGSVTPMNLEPTACGWYQATINNSDECEYIIWQGYISNVGIILTDTKTDRIGLYGLDEGPADWDDVMHIPTPIKFNILFSSYGNTLYFNSEKGTSGWNNPASTTHDPTQSNRCNYTMAGIIYDTDEYLLSSFNDGNTGNAGIRKGIVKPTLVKDSKNISKMQFNQSKNGWSEADFNQAFTCTGGKNAMVCYDIPFKRDSKSLWTFDSDYLCNDGTIDLGKTDVATRCAANQGSTYGFFPDVLNGKRDPNAFVDSACSYANCPSCARTVKAESWVPLNTSISRTCYEYSLSGTGSSKSGCGYPFGEGDFGNGETPSIWDWGFQWPTPDKQRPSLPEKNEYFCFETHADFTYERGQEFFFSGDDDIWVFINNNLVIDLGGSHLAAPGYVALDSIGRPGRWQGPLQVSGLAGPDYTPLVEGNEYKLDIFFCDRRRTMSNIRISTNMYISQKNGLFVKEGSATATNPAKVCMTQESGGSCAAVLDGGLGTQELCDAAVAQKIEYYIINRKGDDKRLLTTADPYCSPNPGNPNELLCYGGIFINLTNGTARVDATKILDLPGTWHLYAKVKDEVALTMSPPPKDVKITSFTAQVIIKMVYGNIKIAGKSPLNICKGPEAGPAVTGELKPVCFSTGNDIDPEEVGGAIFSLNPAGLVNKEGNKLRVYLDSNGTLPVGKLDTAFSIPGKNATSGISGTPPRPNSGSVDGVLVLWVTGDYKQNDQDFEYKINVRGRPASEEVTLTSIVPELQWIKSPGSVAGIPDQGPNKGNYGSKFDANGDPIKPLEPVWIREPVKLNMRAYNKSTGATCKTCNFKLSGYKAEAKNIPGQKLPQIDKNLVDVSGLEIIKGEASISIMGKVDLVSSDGPNPPYPYYATVTINGISDLQKATWDSLLFKTPPVPIPEKTELWDRDGDGIGDSLVIIYNRGFKRDSLPNMIEVFWDKDSTVRYGIGKRNADSLYTADGIDTAANRKYWEKHLILDPSSPNLGARGSLDDTAIKNLKDTIVLVLDSAGQNRARFSKKILTKSDGEINSWASFEIEKTPGGPKLPYHIGFASTIDEKIPAIVIAASYVTQAESGCGTNSITACTDRLTIEFSEPVFIDAAGVSDDEAKNPFAYRLNALLGEKEFKPLGPASLSQQKAFRFKSSNTERPGEDGDSVVYITFDRWRDAGGSSGTPMPGDSVKFAALGKHSGFLKNVLVDINGNPPNPNEIGRQIEGRNPFMQDKIAIGEIDPNSDNIRADVYNVLVNEIHSVNPNLINNMYSKDRPVELLPVKPEWNAKDAASHYKGTIGLLLNPDVAGVLSEIDPDGVIPDSNIVFYARVFYHTNLGSYVAEGNLSLRCDNEIFPPSDDPKRAGKASCRDNRNKIYIAWDMKDSKGRFVGTGAYVGLYDFHWEINHPLAQGLGKMENMERKIEMHGVKRVKRR